MLKIVKRLLFSNDPVLNWLKTLLILAATIPAIIFFSNATTSQDLFWFVIGFETRPARILIYHDGQKTELQAGQPGFAELAEAIRASLAGGVAQQSNTGLSDISRQEAYSRFTSVEAFFDEPVKLHTWFFTGNPTQMLFPITGRHSEWPIVFLGNDGEYHANAPVLKTKEPILQVLRALGYLN